MRDPNRIKRILDSIENVWVKNPDIRLCQLLYILSKKCKNYNNEDLFYLEDSDLELAIKQYKEDKNV